MTLIKLCSGNACSQVLLTVWEKSNLNKTVTNDREQIPCKIRKQSHASTEYRKILKMAKLGFHLENVINIRQYNSCFHEILIKRLQQRSTFYRVVNSI